MIKYAVFREALEKILQYWMQKTPDPLRGGFFGQIHANNKVETEAPRGSVLNARILWSFSAAFRFDPREDYGAMANRAYQYIVGHFIDREHGGVYWSVDADGRPLDAKKQVYALAFTIYGMTEYFAATGQPEALDHAIRLYRDIEVHSFDPVHGGYLEAFSRDWGPAEDVRLSRKDANEKKTMNTHLHVLEAYTNLYRVWKDPELKVQLERLIDVFFDHIIDSHNHHLVLFFDEAWNPKSDIISFGHDIEATWLLQEAAEGVGHRELEVRGLIVPLVDAALEGLAPDGSLYYEYEPSASHWRKERHWWVEAEAMVGLVNAWQVSSETEYYESFERVWDYIDRYVIDHEGGEWIWGLKENNTPMEGEDKVGIWKCPYHNSRALIELIRRLFPLQ